jgi:hypothetical protein
MDNFISVMMVINELVQGVEKGWELNLTLLGHAFTSRQLTKRRDGLCPLEVKQRPLTVFKGSSTATGPKAGI